MFVDKNQTFLIENLYIGELLKETRTACGTSSQNLLYKINNSTIISLESNLRFINGYCLSSKAQFKISKLIPFKEKYKYELNQLSRKSIYGLPINQLTLKDINKIISIASNKTNMKNPYTL